MNREAAVHQSPRHEDADVAAREHHRPPFMPCSPCTGGSATSNLLFLVWSAACRGDRRAATAWTVSRAAQAKTRTPAVPSLPQAGIACGDSPSGDPDRDGAGVVAGIAEDDVVLVPAVVQSPGACPVLGRVKGP